MGNIDNFDMEVLKRLLSPSGMSPLATPSGDKGSPDDGPRGGLDNVVEGTSPVKVSEVHTESHHDKSADNDGGASVSLHVDNDDDDSDGVDNSIAYLNAVNFNVVLPSQSHCEQFAQLIKDAVVRSVGEHFTSIRLKNTVLQYQDWCSARGRTDGTTIVFRQATDALQIAGTLIHELAHCMVGTSVGHNTEWVSALTTLGLTYRNYQGQTYTPEDFTPTLRCTIALALLQFRKQNPSLVIGSPIIVWPAGLEPKPFQIEAVKKMLADPSGQINWLLGDEMGLGKTIEAMIYINSLTATLITQGSKPPDWKPRVLFITPEGLRINVRREAEKWLEPSRHMDYCTSSLYIPNGSDFVIASYEGVRRWQNTLKSERWDLIICDEVHYCKTPGAQRTKATIAIPADRKIGMSGTPIMNYPREIITILRWLDGESWESPLTFCNRYEGGPNNKYGRNLTELHNRLVDGTHKDRWGRVVYNHRPVMIRRLRKDVLTELPRLRRQVIEIPTDAHPQLRKLVEEENKLWNSMEGKLLHEEVLAALNVVREAGMTDEDLADIIDTLKPSRRFLFSEIARVRHQLAIAKLPLVIEHVQDCLDSFSNGEKLVVFTHHNTKVGNMLYQHFHSRRVGSVFYHGGINTDQKQSLRDKFQDDPTVKLFVGTMRAAREGITLTASHHAIFAEFDWTPSVLAQCESRLQRIGQTLPVLVQFLVVTGSMDAFMSKKVIAKMKAIKIALDAKTHVA